MLDPVEDMKICDADFLRDVAEVERFEHRLVHHPLFTAPNLKEQYAAYVLRASLVLRRSFLLSFVIVFVWCFCFVCLFAEVLFIQDRVACIHRFSHIFLFRIHIPRLVFAQL